MHLAPKSPAEIIAALIAHIDALDPRPHLIPLTLYQTPHDYATLRPEDHPHSHADHTALIHATAQSIRDHYNGTIVVELRTLNAGDYLRWLATTHRTNSPESRALYTATHPTP